MRVLHHKTGCPILDTFLYLWLSAGVFPVAMDVSGLPPFAQRTHKGWGTRSCVNTQLENEFSDSAVTFRCSILLGLAGNFPSSPLFSRRHVTSIEGVPAYWRFHEVHDDAIPAVDYQHAGTGRQTVSAR